MSKLPTTKFRALVPKLRKKGFYKHQKQRKISWPEYTLSQINEAKETLIFIKDSIDICESPKLDGRVGRPLTNPQILAKAILACEEFLSPERQGEGWLDILGSFLGIHQHLDDRVIGEAYNRLEVLFILKQVFENSKTSDGKLSGDGTGLETSRKQNHESEKNTNAYMTSIVDSREIVQAFDISGRDERPVMRELVEQVEGDSLRLDALFSDKKLAKKIAAKNMKPFIFPKKNITLNGNLAWKKMYLDLYNQVQEWLKEYHQRSHCESFHSSFKRRNKILMKRNPISQLNQITARIILHNRRRQAYFNLKENN